MSSHKIARISAEVMRIVSEIIANEARDELLKKVTITGCEVTKDLSFAKIYFTFLGEMDKEQITFEMNEAAPFIRRELSEKIELRHTPQLKFVYDESIEYGQKIENIIESIKEKG